MIFKLSQDHSLVITKLDAIIGGQPVYKVDFMEYYSAGSRCLESFHCSKDFLVWEYGDEIAAAL